LLGVKVSGGNGRERDREGKRKMSLEEVENGYAGKTEAAPTACIDF
jgi:hypothetical protein